VCFFVDIIFLYHSMIFLSTRLIFTSRTAGIAVTWVIFVVFHPTGVSVNFCMSKGNYGILLSAKFNEDGLNLQI